MNLLSSLIFVIYMYILLVISALASLTYLTAGATKTHTRSVQTELLPVLDAKPLVITSVSSNGQTIEGVYII